MAKKEMFLIFEKVLTFNKLFAITDDRKVARAYKITKGFEVMNFARKEIKNEIQSVSGY